MTEYDSGFEAGLTAGYRAARDNLPSNVALVQRRKFLAWSTLLLGLGSAAGAIVANRDRTMFTALAVTGGVMTAIIGAAQILNDERTPGPFGIR